MNTIQTVVERGVFKKGTMKGRRYTVSITEYEFIQPVWDLIKAYMIDFDPFLEVQSVYIPRSFLLKYNVMFPFRKHRVSNTNMNGLVSFTKVSDFIKLLMVEDENKQSYWAMDIEEADKADEEDCGLEGYYLPSSNAFLVDFNIQGGGNCPIYLTNNYTGSSPMAYAIGNIIDDDGEGERTSRMRKRDVLNKLCCEMYRGFLTTIMENTGIIGGWERDRAFIN